MFSLKLLKDNQQFSFKNENLKIGNKFKGDKVGVNTEL